MQKGLIITIDGPAGAGKSTIGKLLAKELNYIYIDTGGMYRAITYKALKENIDISNKKDLYKMALKTEIDFKNIDGQLKIFLDGKDVSNEIRTEVVTANTIKVAEIKEIRELMRDKQRHIGKDGGIVMEGRDIGTVVFNKADVKFYLDADIQERAKRRYSEIKDKNESLKYEDILGSIIKRDDLDISREISPLKCADDAIVINSTALTINEVVQVMLKKIKEKITQ